MKKGAAITQEEAQQFQGQLLQQQQKMMTANKPSVKSLGEKHYKFMEDLQKNLKEFLENITGRKIHVHFYNRHRT